MMRRTDRMHRLPGTTVARGFTLIEMLVALAVLGLVVIGMLNLAGESTRSALIIEEKVLAGVVAENCAVDAQLTDAGALATTSGGTEVAGDVTWRWTRRVSATDNPDILRIDIAVMPQHEDRVAAELSLFRSVPR